MQLLNKQQLKKHILSLDQEVLLAKILSISIDDISYCLENKRNKISNPLRIDNDPSLGMMYVLDKETALPKLRLHDFANPFYRGDLFDFAGIIFKKNTNCLKLSF